jgi:hypothetical protein
MMSGLRRFVHRENIAHYKRLIAECERDPSRDDAKDRREPNG